MSDDLVQALREIERLRLATDEGTLAKRADRMWEIAREALGRPVGRGMMPPRQIAAPDDATKTDSGTQPMTDDPVERVARAIAEKDVPAIDADSAESGFVIVPREPTEAMKAVYGEFSREDWLQVLPEDVWQAMIDAALNSPPDGDRGGPPYEIPKVFR